MNEMILGVYMYRSLKTALTGVLMGFTVTGMASAADMPLKAAVPFAPMVDAWVGDDWFHNGAFRQAYALSYVYDQEATRKNDETWWSAYHDTY